MQKVFIIDDEIAVAEMLSEIVELAGLLPYVYNDANQFFAESQFDDDSIIVLDLNMPHMDGVEVIRELSRHQCAASLILMSGYDMGVLHSAEKLAHAHRLEIISSLTKPIKLKELLEILNDHKNHTPDKSSRSSAVEFIPTKEELKKAIERNEMLLYYQPQINLASGAITGAEALVRWQHPEHGLVPPYNFINCAEKYHLMDSLTSRVMDMALDELASMRRMEYHIPISINVSADSIRSIQLPETLSERLDRDKLNPQLVILEVTESALMGELVTSLDILTRLRMRGFSLSIDDFGTGFSSLSLLHKVPFNELKIDKSFVIEMLRDQDARAIVKTCIMLAKELSMSVVAEGVESQEAMLQLKELGCDIGQGFGIARPMPSEEFHAWISQNNHSIVASL